MEQVIDKLIDYNIQVMKSKEVDIAKRTRIEQALLDARANVEYAKKLCDEYKIKLGD